MTTFTVLLDACVLYPAPLRDLLLHLACVHLYRASWTDEIHDEWIRNVLKDRSDLKPEQLARTRELMNRAVPDCLVAGYQQLIPALTLPDVNDRHVLAAAICGRAEVILTFNEKDFPAEVLAPFNIETQHPDEFVCHLITLDWSAVCRAVKNQRANLKNPPRSAEELLDTFEQQGLPLSVSQLRPLADLL